MFAKLIALIAATIATAQENKCVDFTVTSGTGCAWMCNYCAEQLGTNNYYFTDSVCSWEQGVGCTGSPMAGKLYTCCTTSFDEVI